MNWHEKTFDQQVYPVLLKVILTDDVERLKGHLGVENWHGYATTFDSSIKNRRTVVIALNLWRDPAITHGVITHESVHAADFIFQICDIVHDFDNPEPYNYLAGWITNQVYETIHKYKLENLIKLHKDRWIKTNK